MPRIDDFKTKIPGFKRVKYTPWDNSPSPNPPKNYMDNIDETTNIAEPVQNGFKTGFKEVQGKPETSLEPNLNPVKPGFEIGSKTGSEPISKQASMSSMSLLQNTLENVSMLTGSQKKIFLYLINSCCTSNSSVTSNINTTELSKVLNIPKDTVKTSLRRLQEKSLINKKIYKQGVGGFLKFEISENIKTLGLELERNDLLNIFKTGSEIGSKIGSTTPIVSSSYINNTTTIPEEFKNIDCTPLKDIGFDESHIIQIYREYTQKPEVFLSTDIIQNSINALAFDLKYNNAASCFKASPAVVLTAMLKKGQPYSSKTPEKVLSPREAAMQEYLLSQEQKNLKIIETETKAMEIAKKEWLNSLSEEELLDFNEGSNICPPDMHEKLYQISRRQNALSNAKKYFDNIIWPQKLKEILDNKA